MLQKRTNMDTRMVCENKMIEPENKQCVQFFQDIIEKKKKTPLAASVGDEETNEYMLQQVENIFKKAYEK